MSTTCTRFVPTAAVLAAAMLLGGPSFAQTSGASNAIPNAGSKQDPQVEPLVKRMPVTEAEKMKRAEIKAEVKAGASASNAIPNAGAKQDPQIDKPAAVKASKEERLAAKAKRKAERAAGGPSSSNPVNPRSNPLGSAVTNVETSGMPASKN
ncbi:hypothetical protein LP416_14135 [Polaromonas sp. P2-4]|nr:hypothetical protein LP416_14135 [Polaromonas sp. P2-4]